MTIRRAPGCGSSPGAGSNRPGRSSGPGSGRPGRRSAAPTPVDTPRSAGSPERGCGSDPCPTGSGRVAPASRSAAVWRPAPGPSGCCTRRPCCSPGPPRTRRRGRPPRSPAAPGRCPDGAPGTAAVDRWSGCGIARARVRARGDRGVSRRPGRALDPRRRGRSPLGFRQPRPGRSTTAWIRCSLIASVGWAPSTTAPGCMRKATGPDPPPAEGTFPRRFRVATHAGPAVLAPRPWQNLRAMTGLDLTEPGSPRMPGFRIFWSTLARSWRPATVGPTIAPIRDRHGDLDPGQPARSGGDDPAGLHDLHHHPRAPAQAGRSRAGPASLTLPAVPLGFLSFTVASTGLAVALFCSALAILLFRGLLRPDVEAYLDQQ